MQRKSIFSALTTIGGRSCLKWYWWLAYWNHYDTISCLCVSLLFFKSRTTLVPCALVASLSGPKSREPTLEIRTGFDQSGTRSSQSSPDLLRCVFVVYVPLGHHIQVWVRDYLQSNLRHLFPCRKLLVCNDRQRIADRYQIGCSLRWGRGNNL